MSPAQCRAARGWLEWSQAELARRARVSEGTVRAFERGQKTPMPNNLIAMQKAVEEGGVRLLFDPRDEPVGIAVAHAEGELSRARRRSRRS